MKGIKKPTSLSSLFEKEQTIKNRKRLNDYLAKTYLEMGDLAAHLQVIEEEKFMDKIERLSDIEQILLNLHRHTYKRPEPPKMTKREKERLKKKIREDKRLRLLIEMMTLR